MNGRRAWGFALAAALLIIIAIGITATRHSGTKDAIKIGAVLPLTGNLASLGEPERNALLLAVEDARKSGFPVELVLEDSKGNPADAVSAVNKLIAQGIKGLIVSTTGANRAVLPIVDKAGIPVFTQCMDPMIVSQSDYAFRIFPSYRDEQQLVVSYLRKKGYRNVALYCDDGAGIKPEADSFRQYARTDGLRVVLDDTFASTQTDFRSSLLRIRSNSPDALVVLGYGKSYPPIIKQAKESGLHAPIVGNVALEQGGATESGVGMLEGVAFASFSAAQGTPTIDHFRSRYRDVYGSYPGGFLDYPYFYDAFVILADALSSSKGDPQRAMKLLQQKSFHGLSGEVRFGASRDFHPTLAMAVYRHGKVERTD